MRYIEDVLAAGREQRRYGGAEYPAPSHTTDAVASSPSPSRVAGLGRPLAASTHLSTTALTAAERSALTALSGPLAAELLRVERVHVSPMWQLSHGVSGTVAASDVDRLRREARAELSRAAGDPADPALTPAAPGRRGRT